MMTFKRTSGFTLIELMIAIAISLLIIAAISTMFVSMSSSNVDYLKSMRLNHELRSALNMMARDLRRAGHNQDAASEIGSNPFSTTNTTELKYLTAASTAVSSSDVIFSYDSDDDSNIEGYGYRLNNGVIQFCTKTSAACTSTASDWQDLTDGNLVDITDLTFSITWNVLDSGVTLKQVEIELTGELVSDSDFSRTLSEIVTVRNEHI